MTGAKLPFERVVSIHPIRRFRPMRIVRNLDYFRSAKMFKCKEQIISFRVFYYLIFLNQINVSFFT